jgi:hypothetical protein
LTPHSWTSYLATLLSFCGNIHNIKKVNKLLGILVLADWWVMFIFYSSVRIWWSYQKKYFVKYLLTLTKFPHLFKSHLNVRYQLTYGWCVCCFYSPFRCISCTWNLSLSEFYKVCKCSLLHCGQTVGFTVSDSQFQIHIRIRIWK